MGNIVEPDEPEATASMPMLPKSAIHGGLTLVIDHFISKITDCTQQSKKSRPRLRLSVPLPRPARPPTNLSKSISLTIFTKINFYKCPDGQSKTGLGRLKRERVGGGIFCCCVQSVISLMKWSITRRKLPRRAILGSIGMDAVASGSSGSTILPISLVKSDWKLQQKIPLPPAPVSAAQVSFFFVRHGTYKN